MISPIYLDPDIYFDAAILGYVFSGEELQENALYLGLERYTACVYSYQKTIEAIQKWLATDVEAAEEWFWSNTIYVPLLGRPFFVDEKTQDDLLEILAGMEKNDTVIPLFELLIDFFETPFSKDSEYFEKIMYNLTRFAVTQGAVLGVTINASNENPFVFAINSTEIENISYAIPFVAMGLDFLLPDDVHDGFEFCAKLFIEILRGKISESDESYQMLSILEDFEKSQTFKDAKIEWMHWWKKLHPDSNNYDYMPVKECIEKNLNNTEDGRNLVKTLSKNLQDYEKFKPYIYDAFQILAEKMAWEKNIDSSETLELMGYISSDLTTDRRNVFLGLPSMYVITTEYIELNYGKKRLTLSDIDAQYKQ
jgi:hypothetical protein